MDSPTWSAENVRPDESRPSEASPPRVPAAAPQKRRGSSSNAILVVAALVAVGGITFAAGRLTAPAAAASRGAGLAAGQVPGGYTGAVPGGYGGVAGPNDGTFPGGGGALGAGSMTLRGTVTAVGTGSITLKLPSGSTVDISTDQSTVYHGQTAASSADVQVGSAVAVETNGFRGGGRAAAASSAAPAASPGASGAPGQPGQGGQLTLGPALDVTLTVP